MARGPHSGTEIRQSDVDAARFWNKVKKSEVCWLWLPTYRNNAGYGMFAVHRQAKNAHRVAYALANGVTPAGQLVRHQCNNKSCVRPDHLFVGTHTDNMLDRRDGDLTEKWAVVNQIRSMASTSTPRRLAAKFGLDVRYVTDILHNRTWVDPSYTPNGLSGPGSHTLSRYEIDVAYQEWVDGGGPARQPGKPAAGASVSSLALRYGVGFATMYDALHARHAVAAQAG